MVSFNIHYRITFYNVTISYRIISNIRGSYILFISGHVGWAMAVFSPVLINTFFTVFSCRETERRNMGNWWFLYLPLVFCQLYPQFCLLRILIAYFNTISSKNNFFRFQNNLKQFVAAKDGMDGGMGCTKPYCESIPQVFIKTALFAFVYSLEGTNDDDESNKLREVIIEDSTFFLFSFLVSILEAIYGFSKFLRFGQHRIDTKLLSSKFLYVAWLNAIFLGFKSFTLASIVFGHEYHNTSVIECVCWWFLFSIAPSTIMAVYVSIIAPTIMMFKKMAKFILDIYCTSF